MTITLADVQKFCNTTDAEVDHLEAEMFGGGEQAELTPRMVAIVQLLQAEPILCEPCLRWLKQKQAELAAAKLQTLYTTEEIAAMQHQLKEQT